MKSLALIISLAFLVAVSANQDTDDEGRYLDKWGKKVDEYNKEQEKDTLDPTKMEYAEEFQETIRSRRDAYHSSSWVRHERSISRKDDVTQINLVAFHRPGEERRVKRATFNTTSGTWPDRIPYVFNSSYPEELRPKVRRIMKDIMDQLCITWVEEESFDIHNNDYETNAYLHFVGSNSGICGALVGQGSGYGPRRIKTCTSYYTITHELLHTLGTIHDQQGPLSQTHISLAQQNVIANHLGGTYSRSKTPGVIDSEEFDSSSIMMYSRRAFTKNGLDIVIPFRLDELTLNEDRRTNLANNLMELNKVYMCREKHCKDDVDCGIGYYAVIKGECTCVCPKGFDTATNCKELDSENSGPTEWPDMGFTTYSSVKNQCPDGFTHGSFDITGFRGPMSRNVPFPKTKKAVNYHMCTWKSSETNMDNMPLGTYCVIKPKSTECNGAFEEGWYLVNSTVPATYSGDYGGWEALDEPYQVKMTYCCREDREVYYPLEWPRKAQFTLVSSDGKCQRIEGMRAAKGLIIMFVTNPSRNNAPQSWMARKNLVHGFCKYTPGTYGCNEQITLDASNRKATIKTPGFDSNQRTSNKRCLYNFKVPPGARVKVTMDVFDVDDNDLFNVRRFHKWALPQLDFPKKFKKEFISLKDFMFLEWWAGEKPMNKKKGIQFTAEVLLKEESCHSTVDRGKNYIGSKSVSENFEECLPWKDAAGCSDFPFYGTQALDMMSHNFCRNPAGAMERPWCYVSVDKGICKRSYCDVCNNIDELDQLSNCAAMKSASPTFCSDTLQRMKCVYTCGLNINVPPTGGSSSCRAPTVPFDGTPTSPLKENYAIGEIVSFSCNLREDKEVAIDIECTSRGWPELRTACSECPQGWIPYGDRCFFFSPSHRHLDEAAKLCNEKGGRIFEIRDDNDLRTIRYYKQTSSIYGASGSSWVNIKLSPSGQWNLYDKTDVKAPKLEWSERSITNDADNYGCAVMIWEEDQTGNAGKFNTTDCNLARSRTFCEMRRNMTKNHNCIDMSASCLTALVQDPDLCQRTNSYHVASEYCQRACGECAKQDHEICADPKATTYTRTSQNATAYMGDVMVFACNSGLYLLEGNLRRVCGHNGRFLGPEPVCSDIPTQPARVGVSGVLLQNDIAPTKQILLMDVDGFRIPFAGKVTQWHFYAVQTGSVSFVIYRKKQGSFTYRMLGYNQVDIAVINERWTYEVPGDQQISVQEGDVFGMWTNGGLISGTSCSHRTEAVMTLRKLNMKVMDSSMIDTDQNFSATNCFALSLGITVQPQ